MSLFLLGGGLISTALIRPDPCLASEVPVPKATCGNPSWSEEPLAVDGHFIATAVIECGTGTKQSLNVLARRMKQALEASREHHGSVVQEGDASIWDVSHSFEDEGNSVRLREEVRLQDQSPTRVVYDAKSKEIESEGLTSYLREVQAHAEFVSDAELSFRLQTKVRIKRPWFAPSFIFYPMARSKTLSKMKDHGMDLARRVGQEEGSPLP